MQTLSINPAILVRLRDRAAAENCTIDELLSRWLDDDLPNTSEAARDALRRSEELLNATGDMARVGGWELNLADDTVYWTRATRLIHEVPDDYVPTLAEAIAFYHPDDQAVIADAVRRAREEGIPFDLELRFITATGHPLWVHAIGQPVWRDGVCIRLNGTFQDITRRKLAEEALVQSEARLRSLVETQTAYIIRADLEGRITYYNPAFEKQFGWIADDLIGLHALALVIPEDYDKAYEAAAACLASPGQPTQVVLRKPAPDGSILWTLWEFVALTDASGAPTEIQCIGFDITARRQAEDALAQSEARYRMLTELVSDYAVSVRVEPDGQLICEWIVGHYDHISPYPVAGLPVNLSSTHPDDLERVKQDIARTLENKPTTTEYRVRGADGQYLWLRMFRKPVWDETERRVVRFYSVAQDITDYKAAEQRIQIQMRALETAANAIVITNRDAAIEWVNPAFTELTGYSFEEAIGKNPNALVKSGIHDEAFYRNMWDTILSGQAWVGRMINRRKDGRLYTEEQTITPVHDSHGRLTHFIAIKQDITLREQAERYALEKERLAAVLKREQEHNIAVQKAIAALNHDLRTPLSVIASSRDLLSAYFDRLDVERRREKLEMIGTQLHYVMELLNDLALVTGTSLNHRAFNPSPINLDTLCRVMIQTLQETTGRNHALTFSTDGQIQTALVDEVLVNRILLNLLSNAIKYSADGSEVRLELCRRDDWIVLQVADEGIGISAEDLPHIFDPFYRSEAARRVGGTGLGLSIVRDCVERHQGRIGVESQPGVGTIVTVELPFAAA